MFRTIQPTSPTLEINEAKCYSPFSLSTDAGLVYLNRAEVESLLFQCEVALKETDPNYNQGVSA